MENLPDPPVLIALLGTLGVMPFLIVMGTCFVKLGRLRVGPQRAGYSVDSPNIAMHGLALILTVYIMMPVVLESYENFADQNVSYDNLEGVGASLGGALAPYRTFLVKHAGEKHVDFFVETASSLWVRSVSRSWPGTTCSS